MLSKAILLSVQPQHLMNILNGKKTIELRKTFPKDFKGWVYLYCTKSKPNLYRLPTMEKQEWFTEIPFGWIVNKNSNFNGKVLARFYVDLVEEFIVNEDGISTDGINSLLFIDLKEATQLTFEELQKYISVGKIGYAWHIKNLEVFGVPKVLEDFHSVNKNATSDIISKYEKRTDDYKSYRINKAPQNWMYVYEVE